MCKVYIGSFNADVPVRTDLNPHGAELFAHEQADLLQDLYEIPQRSCDRKARFPSQPHGALKRVARIMQQVRTLVPHSELPLATRCT